MPTLRLTSASQRIFAVEQTTNTVERYRFRGLHLTASDQIDTNDLVRLWAPGIHTSAAYTPNDIIFDQCVFRGHPLRSAGRGIRMFVRNGVIRNSYFDYFNGNNDTQAISNFNGPGPLLVQNNYLSASGENLMTGGAIPDIPNLIPANHTIELNAFVKDPAQLLREPWAPNMEVIAGKIVTSGLGSYKALDTGTTRSTAPAFPLTTVNTAPSYPLTPGYVRGIDYACTPGFCVQDGDIRWQLVDVTPVTWAPNMMVRKGDLINYRGPETQNSIVTYYAAQDGVTGSAVPFGWPMPAMNPDPATCSSTYCITDGSTQWQRYSAPTTTWVVKNLLEFKVMNGAIVRHNYFSGSWTDGQTGWGVSFKPENQDPTNSWVSRTENIEFAYNLIENVERPLLLSGQGDYGTGESRNWNIHDNLVHSIRPSPNSQILVSNDVNQLRIVHNTIEAPPGVAALSTTGTMGDNLVMTDNIMQRSGYGVKRAGATEGFSTLVASFQSFLFTNNVVAGISTSQYPPGNYDTAWDSVGFVNAGAEDFRLGSTSPFRNAGTDSKDLGANLDLVPQVRGLSIVPTDRAALFTYELGAGNRDTPCALELSTRRDFLTPHPDVDPARYLRPDWDRHDLHIITGGQRMIRVGKNERLTPGTKYYYRLHCGGETPSGDFRTLDLLTGTRLVTLPAFTQTVAESEDVVVEYSTSYSRWAGGIRAPVVSAPVSCKTGAQCTATLNLTRGNIYYYRFVTRSITGAVLDSGTAGVVAVQ